jgi:hypothetical protein
MARVALWKRALIVIIRSLLLVLGFIFSGIYKLLFSGRDLHLAQEAREQLEREIMAELPFLFSEWNAEVVSEPIDPKKVPPFDYAVVTLSLQNLLLRFTTGRESFVVQVAREPHRFHELSMLLCAMDVTPEILRGSIDSISGARTALKQFWPEMVKRFSETDTSTIQSGLDEMYARDRIVRKQLEVEINRRLHPES